MVFSNSVARSILMVLLARMARSSSLVFSTDVGSLVLIDAVYMHGSMISSGAILSLGSLILIDQFTVEWFI
jgi:hypothetical protein